MKKFIKKHISLLLAALLVISAASLTLFAIANDNVELNAENFPDANFRDAIALMYDTNSDGVLSKAERNINSLIVSGIIEMLAFERDVDEEELPVNNLKGVEFFTELKSLRCSSVGTIESLDLSGLDSLETLACSDLGLKSINLSNDEALKVINVCSNEFTSLDFSDNINLERIHCYENESLTSINLWGLDKLEDLRCDNCALEMLNLTTNTNLSYLNCSYNKLKNLNLTSNTKLVSDGRDITEYNIGFQNGGSAQATAMDETIIVPFELDASRVARTNIDENDTVAYSEGFFFTDDFDKLSGGLTYYYNTGISDSALMSVSVNVSEKEHIYALKSFNAVSNKATTKCVICKDEQEISFADSINAREGDGNYSALLDVTGDGIINAKDFAKLIKEYS